MKERSSNPFYRESMSLEVLDSLPLSIMISTKSHLICVRKVHIHALFVHDTNVFGYMRMEMVHETPAGIISWGLAWEIEYNNA